MRYLWVAAIGCSVAAGSALAKPPPLQVPIPKDFPTTMPVPPPAPPVIYTVAPPPSPPSPPPSPYYGRPASPKGNPGYWATTADYPSAALREEITGVTRFRLTVGIDGRVSQCEVTQSSGSAILDATTCSLVVRRARFNPATDAAGNLAIGTYSTAVRWVIPVDMPPEPGTFTITFEVGADGTLSKCRVKSSIDDDYDGAPACPVEQFDEGFKDSAGKRVARRVTVRDDVTIATAPAEPLSRTPAPRRWRGDRALPLAGTRVTEAIIEVDGTVSDCRIVKVTGPMTARFEPGTNDCPKRFERGYAAANGEPVRTLLRMTETTVIAPLVKGR
ncbi:MAG: energy transducer TonB [Novosphingobium sp.]